MSLLFCDGFDHYRTADVLTKWTSGVPFEVRPGAGRLGSGAAVLITETACLVELALGTVGTPRTALSATIGCAVRPIVMPLPERPDPDDPEAPSLPAQKFVLWSLPCDDPAYEAISLVLCADGSLELRRGAGNPTTDANGFNALCTTPAGMIDPEEIASGQRENELPYVEVMVRLDSPYYSTGASDGSPTGYTTVIKVDGVVQANAVRTLEARVRDGATGNPDFVIAVEAPVDGTIWSGLMFGYTAQTADEPVVALADLYVLNSAYSSPEQFWPLTPQRTMSYRTFLGDMKVDMATPFHGPFQYTIPGGTYYTTDLPDPSKGYYPWDATGAVTLTDAITKTFPDDTSYGEATSGVLGTSPPLFDPTEGQVDATVYILDALRPYWPSGLVSSRFASDNPEVPPALPPGLLSLPVAAVVRWLRVCRVDTTTCRLSVREQLPLGMNRFAGSGPPREIISLTEADIPADTFRYLAVVHEQPTPPGPIAFGLWHQVVVPEIDLDHVDNATAWWNAGGGPRAPWQLWAMFPTVGTAEHFFGLRFNSPGDGVSAIAQVIAPIEFGLELEAIT